MTSKTWIINDGNNIRRKKFFCRSVYMPLPLKTTSGCRQTFKTLLTYDQQGAAVIVPSNNCYTNYYGYFNDPFYFLYFYYNYYYYYIFYYSYYCYIYYYSYFFYC